MCHVFHAPLFVHTLFNTPYFEFVVEGETQKATHHSVSNWAREVKEPAYMKDIVWKYKTTIFLWGQ